MDYYCEEDIKEIIRSLDAFYTDQATELANELGFLVGDMSPYSEGEELTDDVKDLIEEAINYIDNN